MDPQIVSWLIEGGPLALFAVIWIQLRHTHKCVHRIEEKLTVLDKTIFAHHGRLEALWALVERGVDKAKAVLA